MAASPGAATVSPEGTIAATAIRRAYGDIGSILPDSRTRIARSRNTRGLAGYRAVCRIVPVERFPPHPDVNFKDAGLKSTGMRIQLGVSRSDSTGGDLLAPVRTPPQGRAMAIAFPCEQCGKRFQV